jgi:hypothetical protein
MTNENRMISTFPDQLLGAVLNELPGMSFLGLIFMALIGILLSACSGVNFSKSQPGVAANATIAPPPDSSAGNGPTGDGSSPTPTSTDASSAICGVKAIPIANGQPLPSEYGTIASGFTFSENVSLGTNDSAGAYAQICTRDLDSTDASQFQQACAAGAEYVAVSMNIILGDGTATTFQFNSACTPGPVQTSPGPPGNS